MLRAGLPEKDREEVRRELRQHLRYVCRKHPAKKMVKKVLYELALARLAGGEVPAETALFDFARVFRRVCACAKWVLPLVGVVVMVIGFAHRRV
jgi:hypothetical protein